MARAMQRRCCCPPERDARIHLICLYLIPESCLAQTLFDDFFQFPALAENRVNLRPAATLSKIDIVGKAPVLKNHADAAAEYHRVDISGINIFVIQQHAAFYPPAVRYFMHAV